jgi:hypothetical protein
VTRGSLWMVAPAISLTIACTAPPRADSTVTKGPQPNDSLVKLIRKQLTDPDPRRVELEILCEGDRLYALYGDTAGTRRFRDAWARAYTDQDIAARRRAERALVGHDYRVSQRICDSLSRAAKGLSPDSAR